MTRTLARIGAAAVGLSLVALSPRGAGAQATDSTRRDTAAAKPAPPPPALPFTFSGVLYSNYQSGGVRSARSQNRFELERAYLTFQAPAGDRASIRVTGDVFQNRDDSQNGFYKGWVLRAKYAYLQYDLLRGTGDALKVVTRLGMLHTPVVDYEERFWERGLGQTAPELNGFFSSSDLGAATLVTLPDKWGEFYLAVLNGNGYTSKETDRFKDVGGRLTLTPLGRTKGILRTLSLSPWYYKGARASDFATRRGTVLPVTQARKKDRWGVHAGINDPRLTIGAHYAQRDDAVETADTTTAAVPTLGSRAGRLLSGYTIVRPFVLVAGTAAPPVILVFRYDHFRPDTDADPAQHFLIAGVGYELTKKAQLYVDWQSLQPENGSRTADTKTFFVHAVVKFP